MYNLYNFVCYYLELLVKYHVSYKLVILVRDCPYMRSYIYLDPMLNLAYGRATEDTRELNAA